MAVPVTNLGVPLLAFVAQEFYELLTCGILARGFARGARSGRSTVAPQEDEGKDVAT